MINKRLVQKRALLVVLMLIMIVTPVLAAQGNITTEQSEQSSVVWNTIEDAPAQVILSELLRYSDRNVLDRSLKSHGYFTRISEAQVIYVWSEFDEYYVVNIPIEDLAKEDKGELTGIISSGGEIFVHAMTHESTDESTEILWWAVDNGQVIIEHYDMMDNNCSVDLMATNPCTYCVCVEWGGGYQDPQCKDWCTAGCLVLFWSNPQYLAACQLSCYVGCYVSPYCAQYECEYRENCPI